MRTFSKVTLLLLLGVSCRAADTGPVRYVGKTKYLNNARAVVAHTIDDSTKDVTRSIDAMDKYGVKATIFVSTEQDPAPEDRFFNQLQVRPLWPRLRQALDNGHEIVKLKSIRALISYVGASRLKPAHRGDAWLMMPMA